MVDRAKEWLSDNEYRGFRIVACVGSFWMLAASAMATLWILPMFFFGFTSPIFFIFNVIFSVRNRQWPDMALSVISLGGALLNFLALNEFAHG